MRSKHGRAGGRRSAILSGVGLTAAVVASFAFMAAPAANAATPTAPRTLIYNNIPSPLPGNEPSVGFEADSMYEFGGQVSFAGTARDNPIVQVAMSSWGCVSGYWNTGDCSTPRGTTFQWPLTLRIYRVGADNEPGTLIGAVTHTFTMPYRPSANYSYCTGAQAGEWYSQKDGTCYNGKLFVRAFNLGNMQLPDTVIISLAYNTSSYGYDPVGTDTTCFTGPGGCPYDALNVGTSPETPPAIGSQPLPDDAYQYSTWSGSYCDGGTGGTGTFRLDAGCWTGYQPAFKVKAN